MRKKDFEPVIPENPSDTIKVNVGEEITDNIVQKEELKEETQAERVLETENTEIQADAEVQANAEAQADAEAQALEENNEAADATEDSGKENTGFKESSDGGDDDENIEEITGRTLSPGRIVLKRFFRSKLSMTGLILLVALFIFSFIGPLFKDVCPFIWGEKESDYDHPVEVVTTNEVVVNNGTLDRNEYGDYFVYDDQSEDGNTVYVIIYSYQTNNLKPSKTHWLGTDDKGYDIFSRLMYGGRISLTLGFVVIILETFLGVILGGIAGYFGKWVDQLIMRIVDIFNCVPTLPMLMIVGVTLESLDMYGPERLYIMMAMMTLFGWAGTARLVRGQILSLREQDFMLSAEASGLTVRRKIFKHLIPNVIPQLIVSMTLGLGGIILTEATLGYLNIGLPNAYATWGNMINAAANTTALELYPNLWIPPGVCIVLAVLAFNFVGDGLRDAFDPKARR